MESKLDEYTELIGIIDVPDGIIDTTDPCYDGDAWYTKTNIRVKPGKYKCFATVCNFFDEYDDWRIMELQIIHKDYYNKADLAKKHKIISRNIGVDSGLCGFYNHKPDFEKDEDWDNFWQTLKKNDKDLDCDCKPYGVTVASGFGDGLYTLYEAKDNDETVSLILYFGEAEDE